MCVYVFTEIKIIYSEHDFPRRLVKIIPPGPEVTHCNLKNNGILTKKAKNSIKWKYSGVLVLSQSEKLK